jgi:arylsulfatase A-like enzyme
MMRNKRRVAVVNVVSIALAVFCSMPVAGLAVNSARPNVVLFFLDDMGYGDSRVYNPKSTIEMPHFEKLAANGMIFTDGHSTTAVCAPSRYSVLTGNYPWRGRSTLGTWGFNEPPQILDGQRTLGNLMQDMGYRTAIFGKLHLGGLYPRKGSTNDWIIGTDTQTSHGREPAWQEIDFSQRFRRGPLDWGFDYSYVLPSGIQHEPYAFFENDRLVDDPGKLVLWPQGAYGKDTWFSHEGFGSPDWTTSAAGPMLTRNATAFIERTADSPFFIHYCSQSLHEPWYPPLEFRGKKIRGQSVSWQTDMLLEFDQTLGAFIEALEKQGQLSNTLFIITSDNGGWPFPDTVKKGHNPNEGLRGRKGDAWEAGHRVPFVVAWGDGECQERAQSQRRAAWPQGGCLGSRAPGTVCRGLGGRRAPRTAHPGRCAERPARGHSGYLCHPGRTGRCSGAKRPGARQPQLPSGIERPSIGAQFDGNAERRSARLPPLCTRRQLETDGDLHR